MKLAEALLGHWTTTLDMLDLFAAHLVGRDLAPRTAKAYADHLHLFAAWFEQTNGAPLDKTNLTEVDLREYKQHLIQRGARPATINAKLAALRAFGAWCGIRLYTTGVPQQPLAPRWLERRQQAALLREAERAVNAATTAHRRAMAARNRAVILLLLNTGLRVGELRSITDVVIGKRSGSMTVRGKRGKMRSVALNQEARSALLILGHTLDRNPTTWQKAIAELGRRAGVEVTPHVLRHTFAHNLSGRVQADRIAALMGHSSLRTTARYTIPGQQDLQAAVETLE